MKIKIDPLKLASDLIQIKSITPNADKAIDLITVSYTHLTLPTT